MDVNGSFFGHLGGFVPIIKEPLGICLNFMPIELVKSFAFSSIEANNAIKINLFMLFLCIFYFNINKFKKDNNSYVVSIGQVGKILKILKENKC